MRLAALALDYDGTIARDGMLDPAVRDALHAARAAGVAVLLVTGRILADLRRVAGDLGLFDAVVAENGAVVHFPPSDRTLHLGQPPPAPFLAALATRGVDARAGTCVVEMDAAHGGATLALLRELELPLVELFNRGRMMVLPQGISKATGLHEVLRTLRLSEHSAAAIGDAENDHALLEACELGAAVAWGSRALQAVADEVIPGDGPPAVADYVRRLVARPRLPPERVGRRRLLLGRSEDGRELWLAVRGRNVLIAGDPRSGKSHLAGLLAEQLILQRYAVCAIDPEGDYAALGQLPGVAVHGGAGRLPEPEHVAEELRHADVSAVVDLSRLSHDRKRDYVGALIPLLAELRRTRGLPHRLLVDEAHYFLQLPSVRSLLDLDEGGYTVVTYRVAELHLEFLATEPVVLATRLTDPAGVATLRGLAGGVSVDWTAPHDLATGTALLLPPTDEAGGGARRFRIAPRLTDHVRHRQKYAQALVSEDRAFQFTLGGAPIGLRARTLRELADGVAVVPGASLDGHLRRGDFARWVEDVFGDEVLAAQLRGLQSGQAGKQPGARRAAAVGAIRARYLLPPD